MRLLVADQLQLGLRRRLGQEIVDADFGGDGGGGQRIVAGDHHRADAHLAQCGEALADAALDDVLQVDDAESRPSLATASGVPPDLAIFPTSREFAHRGLGHSRAHRDAAAVRRRRRRPAGRIGQHRIDRALADRRAARHRRR